MTAHVEEPNERALHFLAGLSLRSMLTDCPLGAFGVEVERCSGRGDCTSVCAVNVFEADSEGRCTVVNEDLCFGCMACVAQCLDNGVMVLPTEASEHVTAEEILA